MSEIFTLDRGKLSNKNKKILFNHCKNCKNSRVDVLNI